jgi:glycosyltransferase involved in cell wall biosynthesis
MPFSIVIPIYNCVHLLARTLDSVWRQGFTDFEVVVVDDESNDGMQEYLRSLGNTIRIVQQANGAPGGPQCGSARGQRHSTAMICGFPQTLNIFAQAIAQFREPSVIDGQLAEFVDEAQLRSIRDEPYRAARCGGKP